MKLSKKRQEKIISDMTLRMKLFMTHFADEKNTDKEVMLIMSEDIFIELENERDEAMEEIYGKECEGVVEFPKFCDGKYVNMNMSIEM